MGLTYLLGILVAALSTRLKDRPFPKPAISGAFLVWALAAGVALSVVTFAFQTRLLDAAASAQTMPDWQRRLPLLVFARNGLYAVPDAAFLGNVVASLAIVQTLLLLALAGILLKLRAATPPTIAIVTAGACAMAWIATHTQLAGPDIYAYVGFAVNPHPYHPETTPLPVADRVVSLVWDGALPPSPYGPLWTAISHALVRGTSDLGRQLALFRGLGLAALVLCAVALERTGRPAAAALLILDPATWDVYVIQAHNDIVGILLLIVAIAFRRRVVVAVACVALAGAIKLPLLGIGLVVFAALPSLRTRVAAGASAVALGLTLTLGLGGRDFLWALERTTQIYPHSVTLAENVLHAALVAVALAAIAAAVLGRRFFWGAPWSFVAFGQFTAEQYLGWGIPYALLDGTAGTIYLAFLPLSAFEATLVFNGAPLFDASRFVLLTMAMVALAFTIRRRPLVRHDLLGAS